MKCIAPTNPDMDVSSPGNREPAQEPLPLGVRSFGMTDRGLVRNCYCCDWEKNTFPFSS
jgi:hypothetical protein